MEEQAVTDSVPLRSAACAGVRARCFLDFFQHQNLWKTGNQSLDCPFGSGSRQVCATSVLHMYFQVKKKGFCFFHVWLCLLLCLDVGMSTTVSAGEPRISSGEPRILHRSTRKRRSSVCSTSVMRSWFSILFPLLVFQIFFAEIILVLRESELLEGQWGSKEGLASSSAVDFCLGHLFS